MLKNSKDPSTAKLVFSFACPNLLLAVIEGLIAGKCWNPAGGFLAVACLADGDWSAELYNYAVAAATKRGKTIDDVMCVVDSTCPTDVSLAQPLHTVCYF